MADEPTVPPTRAERLHALIERYAPSIARHYNETQDWPTWPAEGGARPEKRAPYVIDALPDGQQRVRLFSQDGDVVSGVGVTLDAALASLEHKLASPDAR